MLFLKNDYSQGAHPHVMAALQKTNMDYTDGYGVDPYCAQAAEIIKKITGAHDAQVHFLPAGTQTNMTAIAAFLRPHHGVISPETGHICVHETGAIEATGHKIIHVPSSDGKIYPKDIADVMTFHEDEHYVLPKMVYISNSTETGNTYTRNELFALRSVCNDYNLLLYIDGARLAMALTSEDNDVDITDIAKIADAFYLGGTKNGLLFGEALVLVNESLHEDFRFLLKQRGGMIAKGRLLGVQFQALLEDNLFFELGAHANAMAARLAEGIAAKNYAFEQQPKTNLIFPIFPKELVKFLETKVMFEGWRSFTDTAAIRLVTSWSTTSQEVDSFIKLI